MCKPKKKSNIEKISDGQGRLWSTQEEVGAAFIEYFSSLFTSDFTEDMWSCLQSMERRITPEMNMALTKPFTKEEVNYAVRQMSSLKAPRLDGLPAGFFQENWETIGDEVCQAVLQTLAIGFINADLNFTCIALIPKILQPSCVSEFRPICNVLYKIISKV
jgi:hypothetical protein